jgi:hypothetical protein
MSNFLIHRGDSNVANGRNAAPPLGECPRVFSPDIRERHAHGCDFAFGPVRNKRANHSVNNQRSDGAPPPRHQCYFRRGEIR